jgi:hypothetical protein
MTKFVGNNITLPKLSAAPNPAVSGDTYYDTTFNKPFTYNGTEWVDLTLTSATTGATGYWGSFWSTQDQSAANTTTAYPITFNNTDGDSSGVAIVSNSRVTFSYSGVYDIQFSAQADRVSGLGADTIDIWFRKNGTDVPDSNTVVTVSGSANASKTVAAWNYVVSVDASDYVELVWRTSDTNLQLIADSAGTSPTRPAVPSVILTATHVMNTQQVELTNSTSTTSSTIAASATAVKSAYDLAGTKAAVGSTTPSTTNTTSSAGSSSEASRADHVHATATSSATPQAVAATAVVGTSGIPSRQDHVHAGVTSITGTASQVAASASAGAVTLSLPQSIATSSTPSFSQITATGGDTTTETDTASINAVGYNQRGGVGYHGFLDVKNTYESATNPKKFFRLNSSGAIEIINNAYTTNLFTLDNDGDLTVPGYIRSGMNPQRYSSGGSAVTTTGVGTAYSDIAGHTVTFTPNYVGQRWLITYTASSHTNINTDQYIIYQVFVDGGNLFYTRTVNIESGINYTTNVSGMDVYTSVGTTAVDVTVGVRMQSSTGVTVSTYYGRLNAVPLT